ncbi:MAG TPA: transglycosylase domain-containing protein [Clostridia bacterium]
MKFKKYIIALASILGVVFFILFLSAFIYVLSIDYIDLDKKTIDNLGKSIKILSDDLVTLDYNGQYGNAVRLKELPDYVPKAFIAIEDKRFYKHKGIDYIRVMGALFKDLKSFSFKEGASTISQQLVKNTHLSNERTLKRKLKELRITKQLEKQYSKDEILEKYLNIIYFGNGLYGIDSAAKTYFSAPAKNLNIAQAAALAAIINSPAKYNPYTNFENLKTRQKIVLNAMHKNGFITKEQYQEALNTPLKIASHKSDNYQSIYSRIAVSQACELINGTHKDLADCIIYTYYDSKAQDILKQSFDAYISQTVNEYGRYPEYAGIIIDNETFGVVGMIESAENLIFTKRQPASTIKPLAVYAPAIESKLITPATLILDEPINYDGYSPKNYNGKHEGWISVRKAISASNNIAAVKTLKTIGIDTATEYLKKLNIDLEEQDSGLSLALGGLYKGVSLYDLTQAYTAFPNGGFFDKCSLVKKITTKDGKIIYQSKPNPKRVFNEDTAYLITDMLQTAAKEGTARRLNSPFQVAAKTGTNSYLKTSLNNDAYCISYTSKHTIGVWLGNYSNDKEGALPSNVTGGTYPTMITKSIIMSLYKDNPPPDFIKPKSIVYADIDLVEYNNNQNLVLANSSSAPRYKKREVFSIYNLPPQAVNIKWEVSSKSNIENKKQSFINRMIEYIKNRKNQIKQSKAS